MTTADLSEFTDLTVVGTGEDIAALTQLARRAGVLVHRTAPVKAAPGDPRLRVAFRLRLRRR